MHGPHGIKVRTALALALLLLGLYPHTVTRAQLPLPPPPPVDRFEWVEGLDNLYPREHGPHLSRPLPEPQAPEMTTAAPSLAPVFSQYSTSREVVHFLRQLHSDYPRLVKVMMVGKSWQGRPIMAVRLGNEVAGNLMNSRRCTSMGSTTPGPVLSASDQRLLRSP